MRVSALSMAFLILCAPSRPTSGQEWTRFRGPNGTGVSHTVTLPTKWNEQDYLWRVKLPGMGHSSPVVWGDRVFLLSADPKDATRYVLCYRSGDGSLGWRRDFPSTPHSIHTLSSFASSTPAVDAEQVYVAWSTPEEITLKAFDHDGKENWSRNLGAWVGRHGFGTSPIVYQDMVILHLSQQAGQLEEGEKPGKSFVMAFDRKSGQELWRTPRRSDEDVCYSVPFIYQPDGGPDELVCTSTGAGMFSLDPRTGNENWSIDVFTMRTVSSPITAGGLIFGSTGSGAYAGNYVVAVRGGLQPELVYKLENSASFKAPYVPCLLAMGDNVFLLYDRGFASCVDAKSGQIHWFERSGAQLLASPVLVQDTIFAIDEQGVVWVIAADPTQFRLLAKNDLGEPSRSTPAVSGGRMFLRTHSQLVCVAGQERVASSR